MLETFAPPFYLFLSNENCWKCNTPCRVVALAATSNEEEGEPYVLNNIHSLPDPLLLAITAVQPNYELRRSQMAGTEYYMNTCPCGAHFGDFYLYSEPSGAFFPMQDEEAARIEVIQLPIQDSFPIDCTPGMGTGGFILQHGKRLDWDAFKST